MSKSRAGRDWSARWGPGEVRGRLGGGRDVSSASAMFRDELEAVNLEIEAQSQQLMETARQLKLKGGECQVRHQ